MDHLPQSLQVVSLADQHDLKPLCRLCNLYSLGPLRDNIDFAEIAGVSKQLRELTFGSCMDLDGLEQLSAVYLGDINAVDSAFFCPLLSLPNLRNIYISPNNQHDLPDELKKRTTLWFSPVGLSKSITEVDQDFNTDFGDALTSEEMDALIVQFGR